MRYLVIVLVLLLPMSNQSVASPVWHLDGSKSCIFNEDFLSSQPEQPCKQFSLQMSVTSGGRKIKYWKYKWQGSRGQIVEYQATSGILGMSNFTVGTLFDSHENRQRNVISHLENKDEIIFGTSSDDYIFVVKGGI